MSNIPSPQQKTELDLSNTKLTRVDTPLKPNKTDSCLPARKKTCDGMFLLSDTKEQESIYLPKKNIINNCLSSPQQSSEISIVSSNNLILSSTSNIQPIKVSASNQVRYFPPSFVDHQMVNGNFQFLSDISNRPYYTTTTNQQGIPAVVQLNQPQFISQIRPNMNTVASTSNQSMIIRPGIIQPRQIIGVLQPVSIRRSTPQTLVSSVKLSSSDAIQSNPEISAFSSNKNTPTSTSSSTSLSANNNVPHQIQKQISKPPNITPKPAMDISSQENDNLNLVNGNKPSVISNNQQTNQKKRPITMANSLVNSNSVVSQNSNWNNQNKKRKFNPILIAEKPAPIESQTQPAQNVNANLVINTNNCTNLNNNNIRPFKPVESNEKLDKFKNNPSKKVMIDEKKKIESNQNIVNQLIEKLKTETKNLVRNPPLTTKDMILPPVGYQNIKYFDENANEPTCVNYRSIKYNQGRLAVSMSKELLSNCNDEKHPKISNYQDEYLLNHLYLDPNLNLCTFKKYHREPEKILPSSPVMKEDFDSQNGSESLSKIFWTVKNTQRNECSSPLLEEGCSIIAKKNLDLKVHEKSDQVKKQEALRISFLPISVFIQNLQEISNSITSFFRISPNSTLVDTTTTADIIVKPIDNNGIKFSFDDKMLKELDMNLRQKYGFQSVHFSIDFVDKIKPPEILTPKVEDKTEHIEHLVNMNLINNLPVNAKQPLKEYCSDCSKDLKNIDKCKLLSFKVDEIVSTIKASDENIHFNFCSADCHLNFTQKMKYFMHSFMHSIQVENLDASRVNLILDRPSNRLPIFLQPMNLKMSKYLSRLNLDTPTPVQIKPKKNPRWNYYNNTLLKACSFSKNFHQKSPLSEEALKNLKESYLFNSKHKDARNCVLCNQLGDLDEKDSGRLLSLGVEKFIHLNCIIWCFDVYESISGSLHNVNHSIEKALKTCCAYCGRLGAGLPCYHTKCSSIYHVPCAIKVGCMFFTDRGMYCDVHQPHEHPMQLKSLEALRKIYIQREDNPLVAAVINDEDRQSRLRIGNIILNNLGQLLPQHLESGNFNTKRYIYPVGFSTTRIYWSMRKVSTRSKYVFEIKEKDNKPIFHVTEILEDNPDEEIIGESCDQVCQIILQRVARLRKDMKMIKLFPEKVKGEDFFGLTKSQIIRAIESFPGADLLSDYCFTFGRMELITGMPLAINPSGCARSEPRYRPMKYSTKSSSVYCEQDNLMPLHSTTLSGRRTNVSMNNEFKFTSANKCQQYRRLKTETSNNVILGRSGIQGFGLFAARDLEPHSMVIEYIGELIRNELANKREKIYESHNRGIYMFRLDENTVIDATMTGGLARYINHSCSPNCYTEFINTSDGTDGHIVIMTNRKISKGEELSYDYKFDFEDCSERIPCLCGAQDCKKWMN